MSESLLPRPGDLGFADDLSLSGRLARAGQFLLRDDCPFWHVFVVGSAGYVFEGMPSGARLIRDLPNRLHCGFGYVRLPLSDGQRSRVMTVCRGLEGTPYSWLDYVALAAFRAGIPVPHLDAYVRSREHMICSQIADEVLLRLGYHLFDDARAQQNVTPGSIWRRTDPRVIL